MALGTKRSYTKALEFGVNDVSLLQNYGEKKRVANGITALVSFVAMDVKYIKGDDGIKDLINSFLEAIPCYDVFLLRAGGLSIESSADEVFWRRMLSKQYMEITDHQLEGILVTFTAEKVIGILPIGDAECVRFYAYDPEVINTLKTQLFGIHQFYKETKTWIVLVNDQLLHLAENETADRYNLDDLLSVKIFKSEDGKARKNKLRKIFIGAHSDIVNSIETATKTFCKVPLERQMCDKTASPFDGRLWLLDQQQYQLLVNYFPTVIDYREEIQDVTLFEFSKETVPGFRRMLFGKRCKFTNEEDRTMVVRTAVLRHFAIVPVYACRFHSQKSMTLFAAALKYNLRELLDAGHLNWQERVRVLYHVASAIAFLHRRRILHLDITSVNIVLDDYCNARLTDFGSAKGKEEIKCANDPEARLGRTEGYLPDTVNLHLDRTVDYFNFGVVIRECLTGELPTRECNCHSHCFLRKEPLCLDLNKQKNVWQYKDGLNPNAESICHQVLREHDINDEIGKLIKELLEDKSTDVGFDIVRRCAEKLAPFVDFKKPLSISMANDLVNRMYKLMDITHTNANNASIYEEILALSSQCLNWPLRENSEAGKEWSNFDLGFENRIKKTLWDILHDCKCKTWKRARGKRKTAAQSDQAVCEVCLLNPAHNDNDQIVYNAACKKHIKLCLSCIKSHYINPIECHSCTTCRPRFGGNNAMLLCVSGNDRCEQVFKNNVQDIENICKSLLHPTLCIRKSLPIEAQTTSILDIENQIDDSINTLVFFFAGHGRQENENHGENVAYMVASKTFRITTRDLEDLAKRRGLETFIVIRDCCYPQKMNEIPGCNLMQLSACYGTEISSAGTLKERNGPFTKYLKAALIVPDERCFPDCDYCKAYYDRVNSAGVVRMEDIHKFIKAHYDMANLIVNGCKPTPVLHLADHNMQTVSFSNSSRINLRINGISNRTISLTFHTEWERFRDDAVNAFINECDEYTARGELNSQDDAESVVKQNVHLRNVVDNSEVNDLQQLWKALQEKFPLRIVHTQPTTSACLTEVGSVQGVTEDGIADGQEDVGQFMEGTDDV